MSVKSRFRVCERVGEGVGWGLGAVGFEASEEVAEEVAGEVALQAELDLSGRLGLPVVREQERTLRPGARQAHG